MIKWLAAKLECERQHSQALDNQQRINNTPPRGPIQPEDSWKGAVLRLQNNVIALEKRIAELETKKHKMPPTRNNNNESF